MTSTRSLVIFPLGRNVAMISYRKYGSVYKKESADVTAVTIRNEKQKRRSAVTCKQKLKEIHPRHK